MQNDAALKTYSRSELRMRKHSITAIELFDYYTRVKRDAVAITQGETVLSYGDFDRQASAIANALHQSGIGEGDRVAALSLNRIEQILLVYATMKTGAVYVPINFRLAGPEIRYILEQSEAKAVFAEPGDLMSRVDSIVDEVPAEIYIALNDAPQGQDRWQSLNDFVSTGESVVKQFEVLPETPAYQMYTSGTTGFPKGVVVTQQQLAFCIYHATLTPPHIADGKPALVVAPLFHAAGLCAAMIALASCRPIVILREFDPTAVVATIANHKIAEVMLVPAMIQAILQSVPDLKSFDLSSLEKIAYGASPITVEVLSQAMKAFDCCFQQGFGMTEVVASATALTHDDHVRALNGKPELLRSCGRAGAFVEVKIVDPETRQEMPTGEVGEITIRAPHVMEGYSKQPDKTAESIDKDGWYFSGDGGYLDDEGYVYIKDRIKDMIVSGGENVYPAEVENVLMSFPGIKDVAVIGLPDEKFGEAVVAAYVVDKDAEFSEEDAIAFCRNNLAGYKIPRRYLLVEELPRNPSGKILKTELRERYT